MAMPLVFSSPGRRDLYASFRPVTSRYFIAASLSPADQGHSRLAESDPDDDAARRAGRAPNYTVSDDGSDSRFYHGMQGDHRVHSQRSSCVL
jgi:hypothetical protein